MERKEEVKVSDDKNLLVYNYMEIYYKIEVFLKVLGIKVVFCFNYVFFLWVRGISLGLFLSLLILIGILFDYLQYGFIVSIGGFIYLYIKDEFYVQCGVKLFLVLFGVILCFIFGLLFVDVVWMKIILFGVIGVVLVYVFGVLKILGFFVMFFVFLFVVSMGILVLNLQVVFLYVGFVFLGGILFWCISMSGWFINLCGFEIVVVVKVYRQLVLFVGFFGMELFYVEQYKMVVEF